MPSADDSIAVLLGEISDALADILARMEQPDDGKEADAMARVVASSLASALAGLKFPQPVVNVAPEIVVQVPPERDQPAPNIFLSPIVSSPAGTQFRIDIDRWTNGGRAAGFIVTKL